MEIKLNGESPFMQQKSLEILWMNVKVALWIQLRIRSNAQSIWLSKFNPVVKVPKVAEATEVKKLFKAVVELVTGP